MKNSKNKVIAAAVCGVIVGSVTTAIFGDFNIEKQIELSKEDEKETIELAGNNENKDESTEKIDSNKEEINNKESEENYENDDSHNKEYTTEIDSVVSDISQENTNSGSGNNTSSNNPSTGNSNSENTGNTSGGNESNIEKPSEDLVTEPEIKDEPVIETPPSVPEPSLTYYDGAYTGSATGYDMGLQVKVDIYLDQIARVTVVSHNETIGICDKAIELIPYRITASQSTNVDIVSGATYTSNGIINAVNDALSKARR